jgi:proteasome lid subunit RPN8/RPN11
MDGERRDAIAIPPAVLAAVYAHARDAFPDECCGYLVGDPIDTCVRCRNAQTGGDHPIAPERGADTAFAITGAELLAFAKSFDGPRPARIVYHSHPNGRAYFSRVDRESAAPGGTPAYPVQHLVVGLDAGAVTEAAQFAWRDGDYVEVARWTP